MLGRLFLFIMVELSPLRIKKDMVGSNWEVLFLLQKWEKLSIDKEKFEKEKA